MRQEADKILKIMRTTKKGNYLPAFQSYKKALISYTAPHIAIKKSIDFLDEKALRIYQDEMTAARKYAEPVYDETEDFIVAVAKELVADQDIALHLLARQFEACVSAKKKPLATMVKGRDHSALVFIAGKSQLFLGEDADSIEERITAGMNEIKGVCAYPGIVQGTARVITDPNIVKIFNQGDILVTGMTRPEFIALFSKASGVITDGGGILCHAAITARELKKPCIIGTTNATKLIKDGSRVELDAQKGTVHQV